MSRRKFSWGFLGEAHSLELPMALLQRLRADQFVGLGCLLGFTQSDSLSRMALHAHSFLLQMLEGCKGPSLVHDPELALHHIRPRCCGPLGHILP